MKKLDFRVWLKESGKMFYSSDWHDIRWEDIKKWHEEKVLMQSTGLKDLEKNYIYEGDIVDVYNNFKEEYFRGSVEYKYGQFYIKKDDLTSHYRWINYEIKVIGTRHGEKLYESLMTREEMAHAEDLGGYYRIPADNRDLNYNKYFVEGEQNVAQFEDYHSHNTERLNVEQIKEKLLTLDYVRRELEGQATEVRPR